MSRFSELWEKFRAWRWLRRYERAIGKGPLAAQYFAWKQQMIEKGLWK
jgi:hypothetical protein